MKINFFGNLSQGAGYSGSSEKLALALEKLGVDVRVISFVKKDMTSNTTEAGKKLKAKPFELAEVGICYGLPNTFTSLFNNKIKIGFTMFETDKIPSGRNNWAGETGNATDIINKLDLLLVPSEHNKKLFKSSGVKIPIEILHLAVDTDEFVPMDRPKRDIFTFYMAGVLTIRKNPGMALSAFLDLYKNNPKVKIVFKTNSGTMGHINMPYSNVKIIDRFSTPEEMFCHMRDADCFVFPSRGEGFGLPPLEAMATGLPVIVSDNTGMSEYTDKRYNYPIPCPEMKPAERFPKNWGNVGNWYEPDYQKLKETMKYVYEHQEEAKEKGMLASKWVRENWSFDNTAKSLVKLIEDVINKKKGGK